MSKDFYKICLRHAGEKDNIFIFWKKDDNGYSYNLKEAELYEESNIPIDLQIKRGDFLVHKNIIEKFLKNIKDRFDRDITILPNIGDVRKILGITTLNFKTDVEFNHVPNVFFKSNYIEKFKNVKTDKFIVKGDPTIFNEYWLYENIVKTENRNIAIAQTRFDWNLEYDYNYIEFKKIVSCKIYREKTLDKWVKIKGKKDV